MSSGRGRSPCDTGPREPRLEVICPGTMAAALATERRFRWAAQADLATSVPAIGNTECRRRAAS